MNQKWAISGSTIQWSSHSDCLDLTNGATTDGNIIQIWACTGGANQKWTLTTGPGSTTPPPTTGHVIEPGASSNTCLTAPTNANGGTVVVQPCNGSTGQAWTQNGQTIVVYGNMCLDVTNGSSSNGVKMQIWSCTPGVGGANQHFTVISNKHIQWVGKSLCLDLTAGILTSGNQVQMWACETGNNNQVWNIV
ncbi:ricin B lectin domain-containing protein [Mycena haematopus]|nr:ricin B lectin domain-containing protein [Mycena haematopus]